MSIQSNLHQRSDYDLYPSTLADDVAFCEARAVDYLFAPPEREMYPERQRTFIEVEEISQHLCGAYRPGHFRGVATVVLKLFQIFQPQVAFFGEKDYQQFAIVKRLVRDLNVPVKVAAVPTVREPEGLAMSSRNRRLNSRERTLAPRLYEALRAARQSIADGERNAVTVKERAAAILQDIPEIRMEYFDLVDVETLVFRRSDRYARASRGIHMDRQYAADRQCLVRTAGATGISIRSRPPQAILTCAVSPFMCVSGIS